MDLIKIQTKKNKESVTTLWIWRTQVHEGPNVYMTMRFKNLKWSDFIFEVEP